MNILFWMDDAGTINPKKDSTYLLIHACISNGLTPYFINSIAIQDDLIVNATQFNSFSLNQKLSLSNETVALRSNNIHAVWIRKDPPVDLNYYRELLILNQYKSAFPCFNDISGVLLTNEKLSATQFLSITPPTLISCKTDEIFNFVREVGNVVLKPLDGFGGQGVFKITNGDTNTAPIIELLTNNQQKHIVCQKLENHAMGDKRILLLNGRPIGAVNRVNSNGHRNNFMSGGHAEAAEITSNDRQIIEQIKPFLLENGLFFVGIDIINEKLIEINVTSPTGLHEINELNRVELHDVVIKEMVLDL
jgi:glutathione synthase